MRTSLLLSILLLGGVMASSAQIQLRDDAADLGVSFVWNDFWASGDFGAGIAIEDFDGDGDLDLFFGTKNGAPLRVYRNDGGTFTDISAVLDIATGFDVKQVLFADLDDDGHRDLVLSLWETEGPFVLGGRLMILRNEGGDRFVDVSSSPVDSSMFWLPTGVTAGDFDRDGDLDLYVSVWKSGPPEASSANRLLRNEGGFRFTDVAAQLGVADIKKSFQPVFSDLNGDGWPDLLIAEDKFGGLTYYENDRAGGFVDRTVNSGLTGYFGPPGTDQREFYVDGMGIAVGDHDNDGDLDVYVTSIATGNVFYENLGNGTFRNVAVANGTVSERNGWGTGFLDLDHDGWLDLFVVNFGFGAGENKLDRVYRNNGASGSPVTFTDVGPAAGIVIGDDGFAMAAGDLDRDGRIDVVVNAAAAPVRIYRNLTPRVGRWIVLSLVGTTSNRDGVGAKVHVSAGGRTWLREQRAGTSYLGFDSHELEFGLGDVALVDEIRVQWPSGHVDVWTDQPVNTRLRLVEGGELIVSNLALPALRAVRGHQGFVLRWRTEDPASFTRFELERTRAGLTNSIATLTTDPERTDYEFDDREALPGDRYTLFVEHTGRRSRASSIELPVPALDRLVVGPAVPNPFNPRTTLSFRAAAGADVRLRVVDAQGRTVREFAAEATGGWHTLLWNGEDDEGRAVASGTYHFVAESGMQRQSTAVTLVR